MAKEKKRIKGGAAARFGTLLALAAVFGKTAAEVKRSDRKTGRYSAVSRKTKGASGSTRAGFKLVKKMAKCQARASA